MHICQVLAPARVLDLGSGFSSLALRHYAASAAHAVRVVSVDDDPRWLDTTRDYLEAHGHSEGELRLWSDSVKRRENRSMSSSTILPAVSCGSPR